MSNATDVLYETVQKAQLDGRDIGLSSSQIALLEQAEEAIGQMFPVAFRYVPVGEENPPSSRLRLVGKRFVERWTPVLSRDRKMSTVGWEVRQSRFNADDGTCTCVGRKKLVDGIHPECGRRKVNLKAYWNEDEKRPQTFAEHVKTLHIAAMSDDDYSGFYPSIPGNDVIHYDPKALEHVDIKSKDKAKMAIWRGSKEMRSKSDDPRNKRVGVRVGNQIRPMYKGESQVLRGGKEITGGRAQWRRLTKDMVLHDPGVQKDWDKVRARNEEKRQAKLADAAERYEKALPRGAEL